MQTPPPSTAAPDPSPITVGEQQFRSLADTAPFMIWIAGTDKLCYFFNQGWLRFTGRTLEAEAGNGWLAGVHPDDRERCLHTYSQCFNRREAFRMEYRLRRHDGLYRWILDHGAPRYAPDGSFAGYMGSCVDVDDRYQQEALMARLVSQRTAELQQAISELKRSNEELEQFAYAASHDMKEPLRKILVFADALLLHPEKSATLAPRIHEAGTRMTNLLDNLLNLSRVRRDHTRFEQVHLETVLQAVLADLDLVISEKGAQVSAGRLPAIRAIPEQIHQLLLNLLGNALKYVPEGTAPRVRIDAEHTQGAGLPAGALLPGLSYIDLSITDNGIGFEPDEAERIFDIFYRIPRAGNTFPGSGIGLALCKKVAANHNGFIYARSTPGQGATFHVLIPLSQHFSGPIEPEPVSWPANLQWLVA